MRELTYRSRVDAWLVAAVAFTLGFMLFDAISAHPESPRDSLASLAVPAVMVAVGRLFGYPCTYTLAKTHLVIRFGVFRQRIPYAEIDSVEPSRSPWTAPALSLRRVKIGYARRFQLVSPREREAFIEALRQRVREAGATGGR